MSSISHFSLDIVSDLIITSEQEVPVPADGWLEKVNLAVRNNKPPSFKVPHSDYFYIRSLLNEKFRRSFTVVEVEALIKELDLPQSLEEDPEPEVRFFSVKRGGWIYVLNE